MFPKKAIDLEEPIAQSQRMFRQWDEHKKMGWIYQGEWNNVGERDGRGIRINTNNV